MTPGRGLTELSPVRLAHGDTTPRFRFLLGMCIGSGRRDEVSRGRRGVPCWQTSCTFEEEFVQVGIGPPDELRVPHSLTL